MVFIRVVYVAARIYNFCVRECCLCESQPCNVGQGNMKTKSLTQECKVENKTEFVERNGGTPCTYLESRRKVIF